jgi:hypothetical protein
MTEKMRSIPFAEPHRDHFRFAGVGSSVVVDDGKCKIVFKPAAGCTESVDGEKFVRIELQRCVTRTEDVDYPHFSALRNSRTTPG